MRPTRMLMDEHRNIERVLDCLERMTVLADTSGHLDGASARQALAFFRGYADRCHHGKEEDLLFPMMEKKGFPRETGPLGIMRDEHEAGRAHIHAMDPLPVPHGRRVVELQRPAGADRAVRACRSRSAGRRDAAGVAT